MKPLLFGTSKINDQGILEIGGVQATDLAKDFGTPLFVYDTALIKKQAQGFKQTFEELGVKHRVIYASKAFTSKAIYQLLQKEGLGFDVVSDGELHTALVSGVNPDMIEFHGNNKSYSELLTAVEEKVGMIVLDNFHELELLKAITEEKKQIQKVMLRVTPGVDAHTHDYILTGQEDSKFGFDVKSGQAANAFEKVQESQYLHLSGIHCHIGSQIFDTTGFSFATEKMLEILMDWQKKYDYVAEILNLGGGFGVTYTSEDHPLPAKDYVKQMVEKVKEECDRLDYPLPEVWIEPGRSIVAEAGTSLYTVGSRKDVEGVRNFVAVDGGMGDNIRPALYGSKYNAFLANRALDDLTEVVTLVGKYCESGDKLIEDLKLPKAKPNDLVAMTTTGAYGYSMASNYNRNQKPAVVFVENGKTQLVVKRETIEDVARFDLDLK